jgi:ectoine hydroxylase-related dioxygenase (phytanoyl-CoA dioxygenase family)
MGNGHTGDGHTGDGTAAPPLAEPAAFHRFHREELPARIAAGNGALAWVDLRHLGTLGLRTPAGAYTYVPQDGSVAVVEGDEPADTVIDLDLESFAGLVSDLDTAPGLFYGGRVTVSRGKPLRFVRWEPGLRALYHGLPIFDPDRVELRDVDGRRLDPTTRFPYEQLAGRHDEARHFLAEAGYVVVTGVFEEDEVAAMRRDADVLERTATPGDAQSWWGRTANGAEVLTRVLNAADRADLCALHRDPRVRAVAGVAGPGLRSRELDGRDGVTVLWKRADVAEGLSDLPWHRDCGMGGHALNCPTAIMTICLTDGSPEAGELRVLPGSHRGSYPFVDGRDVRAPEGVGVRVTAGDVSLHLSDVMHASLPPTTADGPERISVLLAFVPNGAGHHRGGRHYNDVLLGGDGGQVEHLGHKLEVSPHG